MCNWKLFFLFLSQNICCGYSKEPSWWDGSFEHPKHMFKLMDKKIIAILRKLFLLNWPYEVQNLTSSSNILSNYSKALFCYRPPERCMIKNLFSYFSNQNIQCGYWKVKSQWLLKRTISFEHPKHMFQWISKIIIQILRAKFAYLDLCC